MATKSKGILEDELLQLNLNDMSGGLVTAFGPLALGPTQTPDSLNVFSYNGQMLFRGGYAKFASLTATADGCFTYVDVSGIQHLMVWSNGNLYDYRTGTPVLIVSAVYTPGQQIAHTVLNGVMYWATLTVPLRQYNGTTEMPVPNSGGVGVVAPPACNWLLTYAGALVAVYPVPSGVPEPSSFMWSDVNDPTTWFGTAIQTVGSNDGSVCQFGLLMGIIPGAVSNPGVPSTRQLMIGKSSGSIFLYQGPLGTQTENAVPSPVGTVDGNSAVYIPTQEGQGAVMFLGSDGQFYLTNGSSCIVKSNNIKNLVYTLTSNALSVSTSAKFYATYNAQYQYYMCDFGNGTQLIYKWDTDAWWLFQGWPSGPHQIATGANGLPVIFVCSNQLATLGCFQIGLANTNDNGAAINPYYTTPYLHGGKPEREKIYDRMTMFTLNVGIQYKVTATTLPRADDSQQTSNPLIFNDPAFNGTPPSAGAGAIWDSSKWDQSTWGGGAPSTAQPYPMVPNTGRFAVLSTASKWMPANTPGPLRSAAIQVKIAWNAGVYDFRVCGLNVAFMFRSTGFVGAQPYSTEGNINNQTNPFTNTGTQA